MTGNADKTKGARSLIERAAEIYDFTAALRSGPDLAQDRSADQTLPPAPEAAVRDDHLVDTPRFTVLGSPRSGNAGTTMRDERLHVDRSALVAAGFIDPASSATTLSEEIRIVKRQLVTQVMAADAGAADRIVLVSSAHPGDGKTWVTINLALSLSAEKDLDVLLIDADFGKPGLSDILGLPAAPGLMDALVDPRLDIQDLIVPTDMPSLSILPPGRAVNNDTEVLASDRARALFSGLVDHHPRRIVLMDSPPALAASATSELARLAGTTLAVVRADSTSEAALRDALHLLSVCPRIMAVLNGVKFSASGRRFGSYYGKGG